MGLRQRVLEQLLTNEGLVPTRLPRATISALSEGSWGLLGQVFERLDGVAGRDALGRGPGPWDMAFDDMAVELDEEQHFNRYRAGTLDILPKAPWHDAYRAHCADHEQRGRFYGGYWTSDSSERMFGASPPRRAFDGAGPARWRQRAFYDAVKDLTDVRLSRVAVHDIVGGRSLGDILDRPRPGDGLAVRQFVMVRRR